MKIGFFVVVNNNVDETVVVDLNGDFDAIPVSKAHRSITAHQAEVLKYLLVKGILAKDFPINLIVKIGKPNEILLPSIQVDLVLEKCALEDEGVKHMVMTISPEGEVTFDHFGIVFVARWHRRLNQTLGRALLMLHERYGSITYSH